MAPSNWTLKDLPLALFGMVKCLRYQAMPKKGRPPSCGLNLRSNGPSMAQSWGRAGGRQAASLKADCSAPAASPLKKRQFSVRRMRRSAPILISVEAAAARPATPSSNNVAAEQEREKFRIFDSKNQISAFSRSRGHAVPNQSVQLWEIAIRVPLAFSEHGVLLGAVASSVVCAFCIRATSATTVRRFQIGRAT